MRGVYVLWCVCKEMVLRNICRVKACVCGKMSQSCCVRLFMLPPVCCHVTRAHGAAGAGEVWCGVWRVFQVRKG